MCDVNTCPPTGRVRLRCDRGTDTGEEDTEDEDTSVALFESKREVRSLESSFDSDADPDSDGDQLKAVLGPTQWKARNLKQAKHLMSTMQNEVGFPHFESHDQKLEVINFNK